MLIAITPLPGAVAPAVQVGRNLEGEIANQQSASGTIKRSVAAAGDGIALTGNGMRCARSRRGLICTTGLRFEYLSASTADRGAAARRPAMTRSCSLPSRATRRGLYASIRATAARPRKLDLPDILRQHWGMPASYVIASTKSGYPQPTLPSARRACRRQIRHPRLRPCDPPTSPQTRPPTSPASSSTSTASFPPSERGCARLTAATGNERLLRAVHQGCGGAPGRLRSSRQKSTDRP